MNRVRTLLLLVAAIPIAGWLLGAWSETADALGSLLIPAMLLAAGAMTPLRQRPLAGHFAVAVVLLLAGAVAMVPELRARFARPAVDSGGGERLVVVTHNVAVANIAPEETVDALLAADADVLLLQEVDGRFAAVLPRLRARYRWGSECRRRCSLAIFARYPLDRVRYRLRDRDGVAFGPPLVQTVMRPPGRAPVPLVTLHLPWPLPAGPQRAEREALAQAIAAVAGPRTILAGDFNLAAWSHAMRRLDAGLNPLARVTRMLPTFPARVHGVAAAPVLPIDHLFAGPGWRVESVARIARTGSDHFGVRVVLIVEMRLEPIL